MATAAAAVVAKARREIQHHFFAADAVRADRAVSFTPASGIEARQFAKFLAAGIVRREAEDRYWIDIVAYDAWLQRRYQRVRLTLTVLVIIVAAGLILAEWGGR